MESPDGRYLERDLLALFEKSSLYLERELLDILASARSTELEKLRQDVDEKLLALRPQEAGKWRIIKRRWQTQLQKDLDETIISLREETKRA